MIRPARIIIVALLLAVAGCATSYRVGVDSLAAPVQPTQVSVFIMPLNKATNPTDLQFLEFASQVAAVLQRKGMTPAASRDSAAVIVYLGYGVGQPNELVEAGPPMVGSVYSGYPRGPYSGPFLTAPAYVETTTTYQRSIVLLAYEQTADSGETQIWRTVITTRDDSSDLRGAFPIMLAAAAPYIGTNTPGLVTVTIDKNQVARVVPAG